MTGLIASVAMLLVGPHPADGAADRHVVVITIDVAGVSVERA